MPQLGETVDSGKIVNWFKGIGDDVAAGETLFEIETDKASMEVPTLSAGKLVEIRIQRGQSAPVGAVVCIVEGVSERAASASLSDGPAPTASRSTQAPAAAADDHAYPIAQPARRDLDPFNAVSSPERNYGPATLASGVKVTPLARRLATLRGADLSRVSGSGPGGRIVARDVELASAPVESSIAPSSAAACPNFARGLSGAQVKALYADVAYQEIELDGMRRTIAKRLVESTSSVPHFYLTADIGLEELLETRSQINNTGEIRISINDFVVKAFALALQRVPNANAIWAEDRILRFNQSDVGVVVAVEGGLFTPVIRSAETKTLSALSAEIRDLAARARQRKLAPREYQGGSAAVSNLGMYGVRTFSAVINQPHATILAVGAGERRPTETPDGGVRFASQMSVTLSCDHRVVDGLLGAQLLAAFKGLLENPISILL